MNDPVAVSLEGGAVGVFLFLMSSAAALGAFGGVGRQTLKLFFLKCLTVYLRVLYLQAISLFLNSSRDSDMTFVSVNTGIKLVSPSHRGTM